MKTNGFHASTIGGKRIFAVSIIVALILASVSAIGVFAAPTKISGGQLRELGLPCAGTTTSARNPEGLTTLATRPSYSNTWTSMRLP